LTSLVTRGARTATLSAALLAMTVLAAAGCDSGGGPKPSGTPTTAPATTTPPPPTPTEALRTLAQAGTKVAYRATYTARQKGRPHKAKWIVWHTPTRLRVDVVTGNKYATLITTPAAAYACGKAHRDRTCFRVAKGDEAIPPVLRLDAQELFSKGLAALAQRAGAYRISTAPVDEAPTERSGLSCFRVRPGPDAPKRGVSAGTYCFVRAGVLASVTYPSGNTVELDTVAMRTPERKAFKPYASPTPLP
jgi:hypothetical protein